MYFLEGKSAIITGGASGIGRATALLFAQAGAAVLIADIDELEGNRAASQLREAGKKAIFANCDVTLAADCRRTVETAVTEFGKLDILFNNAGIIRRADVIETSEEEWERVMAVNLRSVFLMSKYAIPEMAKSGGGSIINTSSGWGLKGGWRAASYCASKGAVVNLTRAMAIDHGPQKIRVNCLCPGDVDTPMLRREAAQLGQDESEFLKEAAQRPLGRYAQPEEIAQAALFLASEASSYMTGAVLLVDGGGLA